MRKLLKHAWVVPIALFAPYVYRHIQIIFFPLQAEYREGACLLITRLFRDLENPFRFEAFPAAMTMYGFLYNFAVLPFTFFVEDPSALWVHRMVTAFFLAASIATLYRINRRNGCPPTYNAILCLVFYAACFTEGVNFATLLAQPATLGMFLMLLAVDIPVARAFSRKSLTVSALISVACFFTKPYFIFGFLLTAIYCFCFVSKSRAVRYGLIFALAFLTTAAVVNSVFPLYFAETYYMGAAHYSVLGRKLESWAYFVKFSLNRTPNAQLQFFVFYYAPILGAALGVFLLTRFRRGKFHLDRLSLVWAKPLFDKPLDIYLIGIFLGVFVFIAELGGNPGAWMQYLIQLPFPFIVLFIGANIKALTTTTRGVVGAVTLANVGVLLSISFPRSVYTGDQGFSYWGEWAKLRKIAEYQKETYATPVMTTLLLSNYRAVYYSGQSALAAYIPTSGRNRPFFSAALSSQIVDRLKADREITLRRMREGFFDRVVLDNQDLNEQVDLVEALKTKYRQTDSFQADMPISNQHWVVTVYELKQPKPKDPE